MIINQNLTFGALGTNEISPKTSQQYLNEVLVEIETKYFVPTDSRNFSVLPMNLNGGIIKLMLFIHSLNTPCSRL